MYLHPAAAHKCACFSSQHPCTHTDSPGAILLSRGGSVYVIKCCSKQTVFLCLPCLSAPACLNDAQVPNLTMTFLVQAAQTGKTSVATWIRRPVGVQNVRQGVVPHIVSLLHDPAQQPNSGMPCAVRLSRMLLCLITGIGARMLILAACIQLRQAEPLPCPQAASGVTQYPASSPSVVAYKKLW